MTNPTRLAIRLEILHENNEAVLSDDYINQKIADAVTETGQSDELALRYYTCFLIANGWESISSVQSREGVTYRAPNPANFLNAYQERLKKLGQSSGTQKVIAVFPINKDVTRDATTNYIRRRKSGDPYTP